MLNGESCTSSKRYYLETCWLGNHVHQDKRSIWGLAWKHVVLRIMYTKWWVLLANMLTGESCMSSKRYYLETCWLGNYVHQAKRSIWDLVWRHIVLRIMVLKLNKSSTWHLVLVCTWVLWKLQGSWCWGSRNWGQRSKFMLSRTSKVEHWNFKLKIPTMSYWLIVHQLHFRVDLWTNRASLDSDRGPNCHLQVTIKEPGRS